MIVDQAVYRGGTREPCDVPTLAQELEALRADGAPDQDFLWIGLKDPTPEEFEVVRRALDLHPLAVEDALDGEQRAKLEAYDTSVYAVVKTLDYDPATSDIETGEVSVILGPHVAVTLRHGEIASLRGVRRRMEEHQQALLSYGPLSVLHGVLDTVVDTYTAIDEAVGSDLETIERDVFGGGNRTHSTTIYRLKREVLEFRRAAVPLGPVLHALTQEQGLVRSAELRLHFRDVADHLSGVLQDVESYDKLLSDILGAHLSQIGVQQNADMRRISAWAAMIAVPTLVAGIYGMNFDHMPELHWALGYPMVLGLMALAVGLLHRAFRRSGWL
ncbi:magnesium/cobalt transporter CorA [Serinicoccus sediminis]|uniref:magnesium/cobalt transporter CorA n=1 Tax=Serinicoccus sediminis TaxID=2306021 RepID=UPI0010204635|nr:magnesium/cobalt transporter CorA [Serinicoccus sediminis]